MLRYYSVFIVDQKVFTKTKNWLQNVYFFLQMAGKTVEVEQSGRALKVHTHTPHLVSLGGGRWSTAVTLHQIPEGEKK